MIAKLDWRQSNAQQNIEQPQNPKMGVTMGVTINNESTTNQQQQNHHLRMENSQSHLGGGGP